MKFDVIIGNPPYQVMNVGGRSAKPFFHQFVNTAKETDTDKIVMIIPARWYAVNLELKRFRQSMTDGHLRKLVDYESGKDCFADVCIAGGVCYFLWDRNYNGPCEVTNVPDRGISPTVRRLDEFPSLVRYNGAVSILRKIRANKAVTLDAIVKRAPYHLPTNFRGSRNTDKITVHSSGGASFIRKEELPGGHDQLNNYRIMISGITAEFSCEPDENRQFKVLSPTMRILGPNEVCTDSYRIIGGFPGKTEAENLYCYLETKFVRFLLRLRMTGININEATFRFVPIQDFTRVWDDKQLYQKYGLDDQEIKYIEEMIKSM